jgi:hypothetical protein
MEGGMKRTGLWMLAVVLAVSLASPLAAQSQTKKQKAEEAGQRALIGFVTGVNDEPVEQAVVQLKDMKTLQVRSFITKKDGQYHFSGLSKDVDYQVKAEFQGSSSATKTLSVFDNRPKPNLNLKLEKK